MVLGLRLFKSIYRIRDLYIALVIVVVVVTSIIAGTLHLHMFYTE